MAACDRVSVGSNIRFFRKLASRGKDQRGGRSTHEQNEGEAEGGSDGEGEDSMDSR